MGALEQIIGTAPLRDRGSWSMLTVDDAQWRAIGQALSSGDATLLGLWGESNAIHMAVQSSIYGKPVVASLPCPEKRFPSIGACHTPALRLERAARDLYGLQPIGSPDKRPWLDHGRAADINKGTPYDFVASEGDGLHHIPVGPIHAGIIEPGHFRFTVNGELIVRLEARLGYVHKGIEALMSGADLAKGAKLAARVSGDSTIAYSLAFAQAVENAAGVVVPTRAIWLRALLCEFERIANHLGDFGAICNDASFSLIQAHCAILREQVLRCCASLFGHRLGQGVIIPGGLAVDIAANGRNDVRKLIDTLRQQLPSIVSLYDNTASLQDRMVSTGILKPALAARFGAGGYVGRASGRVFDARKAYPYASYDQISFEVPVLADGDVNARVWIRIREIEQSLLILDQVLAHLQDDGAVLVPVTVDTSEACYGLSIVEGFRGDILVWLRLGANGRIERCHLRDPSWFQWPLLEAAIEGNIVADFPLCNKSFNCSYSGHDL